MNVKTKYSPKVLKRGVVAIFLSVILQWAILTVSYILFEMKGSIIYYVTGGVYLTFDGFLKFVEMFMGRPVHIKRCIPYPPYYLSDFYDPFISTIYISMFWVICGMISQRTSDSLKIAVLCAISQLSLIHI